jgi:hypothetical protein
MKEKRYIKKSTLNNYSESEWLTFFKSAEIYDYIVTDDAGEIIDIVTND